MRQVRLLFLGLLITFTFTLSFINVYAQTCPAIGATTRQEQWRVNQHYDVFLHDSSLSPCAGHFQTAFNNWQNSFANDRWNVSFSFSTTATPTSIRIYHRFPTSNSANPRCQATDAGCFKADVEQEPVAYGYGNWGGEMELNPNHADCAALAQTVAHEIGHSFGLDDCNTCGNNSIMGPAIQNSSGQIVYNSSLPNGPTSCDQTRVREHTDDQIDEEEEFGEDHDCQFQWCSWGSSWDLVTCSCVEDPPHEGDPLILDLAGDGLNLTSVFDGVRFDLRGRGVKHKMGWTARNSDDAWLALDRNGNGTIDDGLELFSDAAEQVPSAEPNGFLALAVFDQPAKGGNGDGRIDAADRAFASLVAWQDRNHDGISQPDELIPLAATGVQSIALDYSISGRHDRSGNYLRYRAKISGAKASSIRRWAYDVFVRVAE